MSNLSEPLLPLSGLRVIDWTHVLAGPFVGYQLALLGAEVIRIERPDQDDMIRSTAVDPELGELGLGEAYLGQGAGKRSVALDAKSAEGRAILRKLIANADVLVENFRPGKLRALGLDPAALIQEHPKLIVCSVTGFGPNSDRRAYDHVVQAASGLMVANASAQGTPRRVGFPLVDYGVGQQAAMAVLAALYRRDAGARERSCGEWIQVSMMGAALTLMAPAYIETIVSGRARPRSASTAFSGSPVSGTFKVADGWIAVVCNATAQTEGLFAALESCSADPAALSKLREAIVASDVDAAQRVLGEILQGKSAADWELSLASHGVPGTVVRSPAEAATEASKAWPRITLPATRSSSGRTVAVPGIGFTSTEPMTHEVLRSPPRRGQDTRAVLSELGMGVDQIDELISAGLAAEPDATAR